MVAPRWSRAGQRRDETLVADLVRLDRKIERRVRQNLLRKDPPRSQRPPDDPVVSTMPSVEKVTAFFPVARAK